MGLPKEKQEADGQDDIEEEGADEGTLPSGCGDVLPWQGIDLIQHSAQCPPDFEIIDSTYYCHVAVRLEMETFH